MSAGGVHAFAKALQGLGLVVVLVGVVLSIGLGMGEQGLESMKMEMYGLIFGGLFFFVGWMLERRVGGR